MNTLMTMPVEQLSFLSRQMKANILDFATGARDIHAPYGVSSMGIAVGLLTSVESAADKRDIDRTGPEWGPNVDGARMMFRELTGKGMSR